MARTSVLGEHVPNINQEEGASFRVEIIVDSATGRRRRRRRILRSEELEELRREYRGYFFHFMFFKIC